MAGLKVVNNALKYDDFDVWHKGNLDPQIKAPSFNDINIHLEGNLIRIPYTLKSSRMVSFNVNMYKNYEYYSVNVSFYLYNYNDGEVWKPKALLNVASAPIQCKIGHDESENVYLWFGNNSSYIGLTITDIVAGHTGDLNNNWYYGDWDFTFSENGDEITNVDLDVLLTPPHVRLLRVRQKRRGQRFHGKEHFYRGQVLG